MSMLSKDMVQTLVGNIDHKHLYAEFGENNGDGYVESGNFKFLGAPVGDRAFIESFMKDRLEKSRMILEKAGKLDHPRCALHILRT